MRADRLVAMLTLLQTRGRMTAQELARRLEVSERTIYRDIVALGEAGIPVTTEGGPGGGCALIDHYRTHLTGLNMPEIAALFPAHAPGPLDELGLAPAQRGAYLKLAAALPDALRHNAAFIAERVLLDASGWFSQREVALYLTTLYAALMQGQQVRMRYRHGNGDEEEVILDPYGLVAKSSIWYVVGAQRGELRVYRVSRIRHAEATEMMSERPAKFDLPSFWQTWSADFAARMVSYVVKLRIMPEGEAVLPEILGESIRPLLDEPPLHDATGWRVFDVSFSSFYHARTVMLGLGELAEALAPDELRRSVYAVAQRLMQTYMGESKDEETSANG